MFEMTAENLGKLLYKSMHETRRALRRFVKESGGEGTEEELTVLLRLASGKKEAIELSRKLERQRVELAASIEASAEHMARLVMSAIEREMVRAKLTQKEIADRTGISQPAVSLYFAGKKQPGIVNLVKLAAAVNCQLAVQRKR